MRNRVADRLKSKTIMFGQITRMRQPDEGFGVIGVKIDYDYGDTPEQLALKLGEALGGITVAENEGGAFTQQALSERRKATELRNVLQQIERDPSRKTLQAINPDTGLPRRMNPYKEYSVEAIEAQLADHESNAAQFDEIAVEKRTLVSDLRREVTAIQEALKEAG